MASKVGLDKNNSEESTELFFCQICRSIFLYSEDLTNHRKASHPIVDDNIIVINAIKIELKEEKKELKCFDVQTLQSESNDAAMEPTRKKLGRPFNIDRLEKKRQSSPEELEPIDENPVIRKSKRIICQTVITEDMNNHPEDFHLMSSFRKMGHTCKLCDRLFYDLDTARTHVLLHLTSEGNFVCKRCDLDCHNITSLETHRLYCKPRQRRLRRRRRGQKKEEEKREEETSRDQKKKKTYKRNEDDEVDIETIVNSAATPVDLIKDLVEAEKLLKKSVVTRVHQGKTMHICAICYKIYDGMSAALTHVRCHAHQK